jgi:erythronate-4-phosphate dehydrogenase
MIIALDHTIPYWEDAFSGIGEIRLHSGGDLKPENIRGAEALIVRSTTPIYASLLDGSNVRFVGAASAGIDHIDLDYLRKRGIHFSYAAGCNADAVSEYIFTALYVLAVRGEWELKKRSLGVIGVGNVGSRVAKKAKALGMEVLLCDPPLRDRTGDAVFQSFDRILEADILTFHVPLVFDGSYPTWHMLDRKILNRLSPRQILINTSRGAVFEDMELKAALNERKIGNTVLDVWEGEPRIDYALMGLVDIGTPHIAGAGQDGKIRATETVRRELCDFFRLRPPGNMDSLYPKSRSLRPAGGSEGQTAIVSVLLQALDIVKEDLKLRALKSLSEESAAENFGRLRSDLSLRPEFRHFAVQLSERQRNLAKTFESLGFQLGS